MTAVQFHFTEEQDQFRDMVRRFLADTSPTTEARRLMDTEAGYDPQVWRRLAGELGLAGLGISEAHGGAGFGAAATSALSSWLRSVSMTIPRELCGISVVA